MFGVIAPILEASVMALGYHTEKHFIPLAQSFFSKKCDGAMRKIFIKNAELKKGRSFFARWYASGLNYLGNDVNRAKKMILIAEIAARVMQCAGSFFVVATALTTAGVSLFPAILVGCIALAPIGTKMIALFWKHSWKGIDTYISSGSMLFSAVVLCSNYFHLATFQAFTITSIVGASILGTITILNLVLGKNNQAALTFLGELAVAKQRENKFLKKGAGMTLQELEVLEQEQQDLEREKAKTPKKIERYGTESYTKPIRAQILASIISQRVQVISQNEIPELFNLIDPHKLQGPKDCMPFFEALKKLVLELEKLSFQMADLMLIEKKLPKEPSAQDLAQHFKTELGVINGHLKRLKFEYSQKVQGTVLLTMTNKLTQNSFMDVMLHNYKATRDPSILNQLAALFATMLVLSDPTGLNKETAPMLKACGLKSWTKFTKHMKETTKRGVYLLQQPHCKGIFEHFLPTESVYYPQLMTLFNTYKSQLA